MQRLNSLMAVENATGVAPAKIGGGDYGFVAVVGHHPNSDYDVLYKQKKGSVPAEKECSSKGAN